MEKEAAPSASPAGGRALGAIAGLMGCVEFISVGDKAGASLLSAAAAVALARRGSRVAYLIDMFGQQHADPFRPSQYTGPWPHVTPDLLVAPGQLRVALQTNWTAGGPRAALAGWIREMSESQPEHDRTGWLSPEAVEAWERPLPLEHELAPDQRRARYRSQAARTELRRMLADGEVGDIVVIDSGHRPRVIGVPIDYTLVVHKWQPEDWLDFEDDSVPAPRVGPRETAQRLAKQIGTPPAGPWALVVTNLTPVHPRNRYNWTREYFDALGIGLRELGMTGLDHVAMVRHLEDLRHWQRALHLRPQLPAVGGPVNAFRPEGFLADGLNDLLNTVTRALHDRPQPC